MRKLCDKYNIEFIGTLGLCKTAYHKGCFSDKQEYLDSLDNLRKDLYLSEEIIKWAKNVD
ncbi:MAG: hypothetical protein HeimC3_48090 [Candidatus Heimdallarchaeota archaeon LC_3]|nr:MAG: hypothetical protein HeimC3_48090 [Candidatus Heimdallarchaeota archaeon LC_3]